MRPTSGTSNVSSDRPPSANTASTNTASANTASTNTASANAASAPRLGATRSSFAQRFLRDRRKLAFAALGLLLLAGLLAGGSLTPGLMADELAERLEERLGLELELDDLEVGPRSVVLSDIVVNSPEGDVELQIERLQLVGDLVALAQREAHALERVRVEGAHASFDLDHPAAAERVAAWRQLISSDDDGDDEAAEGPTREASGLGALDTLMSLMQDDMIIDLANAHLQVIEKGKARTLLDVDRSLVFRRGENIFDLDGNARHAEGELRWDARANLDLLSIDGDFTWTDLPVAETLRWLPDLPIDDPNAIRTSGRARLQAEAECRLISVDGHAEVAHLDVDSPILANRPVRDLSLRAEGTAVLDLAESQLRVESGRLSREGVEGTFDVAGTWTDGLQVELEAELPQMSCDRLIQAIPDDLIGSFTRLETGGKLAAQMSLELDTHNPDATDLDIDVDDDCQFGRLTPQIDPDYYRDTFRQVTHGRDGQVVHAFETGPGTPAWTPIEEVSPFLIQAILASEDAGFFRHSGFAVYAMESALENNLREGHFAFGASTITMQLSKNLFLTRDKTVARKMREVLATWWLEHHFTKPEILELYVNVIEFGPDLFGIRDAAELYFGRHPLDLTPAESVFLATLLPSPVARAEQYEDGQLWASTEQQIGWMLRHMERKGRLDTVARDHGMAQLERFSFYVPSDEDLRIAYTDERYSNYGGEADDSTTYRGQENMGRPGELPFPTSYDAANSAQIAFAKNEP